LPDGPVLTPGAAEDACLGDIVARRAQVADRLFTAKHQLGGAGPVTAADHLEGLALGALWPEPLPGSEPSTSSPRCGPERPGTKRPPRPACRSASC
jgi:hypothetical protein